MLICLLNAAALLSALASATSAFRAPAVPQPLFRSSAKKVLLKAARSESAPAVATTSDGVDVMMDRRRDGAHERKTERHSGVEVDVDVDASVADRAVQSHGSLSAGGSGHGDGVSIWDEWLQVFKREDNKEWDIDLVVNTSLVAVFFIGALWKIISIEMDAWRGWTTLEIATRVLPANWGAYLGVLAAKPVLVKALTSGTAYTLGDGIAQITEGTGLGGLDRARVARNGFAGLVGHGPLSHYWYILSESFFASIGITAWWAVFPKLVVDLTLWGPFFCSIYLAINGFLEGKRPEHVLDGIRTNVIPLCIQGAKFWGIVGLATYSVIPIDQRLLWVDLMELFWVTILSTTYNRKEQKEAKADLEEALEREEREEMRTEFTTR
ncbi:unnamed protein product [Vitrella brassicaformis CCMP3155]|uniref:Uncharacterized protein n=1 Tax=Vitrella brassicaformis (strain CCMP3155) TaxID=1169540 RepID=A0A0G4G8V1_VITBC|nr:unnamed protein product [Vitrella brassicaformis CCMP3155]|mmetsp:Transcript_38948/g.97436  ORF Transcript_38948/g.97436 Transcript_38948/m.97436 type:complete len:381 (-) Transcript_38948:26-1168(-)|eukprot:CEM25282.1 unnamed protein product [Vitrella brassicaformis CCMP3155]